MSIVTLDPAKKSDVEARIAAANAAAWLAGEVAKGFTTPGGWKLGLSESDVTLLTGNYVLAKEAAASDLPLPPLVDTDGVPHVIDSISAFTELMLAYGQHRAALSIEYATRKAAASN